LVVEISVPALVVLAIDPQRVNAGGPIEFVVTAVQAQFA
jgi:hypothetical protein